LSDDKKNYLKFSDKGRLVKIIFTRIESETIYCASKKSALQAVQECLEGSLITEIEARKMQHEIITSNTLPCSIREKAKTLLEDNMISIRDSEDVIFDDILTRPDKSCLIMCSHCTDHGYIFASNNRNKCICYCIR